ncbi:hypothetical protein ACF0H5_006502 [Mactra antiquata]
MYPTEDSQFIYKGTNVASLSMVKEVKNLNQTRRETIQLPALMRDLYRRFGQKSSRASSTFIDKKYSDVFSKTQSDLGRTGIIRHRIHTGNTRPIKQPLRRLPEKMAVEAQTQIEDMLDKGIIQPSTSHNQVIHADRIRKIKSQTLPTEGETDMIDIHDNNEFIPISDIPQDEQEVEVRTNRYGREIRKPSHLTDYVCSIFRMAKTKQTARKHPDMFTPTPRELCRVCGKTFKKKEYMKQHMKRMHGHSNCCQVRRQSQEKEMIQTGDESDLDEEPDVSFELSEGADENLDSDSHVKTDENDNKDSNNDACTKKNDTKDEKY